MTRPFGQQISGVEFADRFTQINGLYLAETQQINKEKQTGYRISGIIIVVSLILQVVGAIDFKKNNTSIPWLLISALAVGLVGCVILVRAMSSRDSKIKKLHVCYEVEVVYSSPHNLALRPHAALPKYL